MADELSLGSVLNYQGNAKDALTSGNFMPDLTLSPETQAVLAQFGQQIIDKKKKDFEDWHNNTVKAIASVQDTHDAYSGDISALNEQSKELMIYFRDNPEAMASNALVKNPNEYYETQSKIGNYAAKVNESRSFNAILKQWDKQTATNTDMNNEVNAKQIEMAKQQPLESRMDYISRLDPVSSGEKEQKAWDALFYKNPSFQTTETIDNPEDKGTTITTTVGVYDKNAYLAGFKSARGDYFEKKWQLDPKLQEQFPLVDDYIAHEAEPFFKEKVAVGKPIVKKNEEFVQGKIDDRQDQMIEFKDKELKEKSEIAFARINSQEGIAEMRAANKPELNTVVDRYNNVDKSMAEGSINTTLSNIPVKMSVTMSANTDKSIESWLSKQKVLMNPKEDGKVAETPIYRDANAIARVEVIGVKDKVIYVPAFKMIGEDGNEIIKIDQRKVLSPKDVMMKMATTKEESQVNDWYKEHPQSSTSQPAQPQKVSAEKQLENPQVNQYLKSSYLNLKKVYPTIDTSGIIGDTAHKERKSDHNNMDAIDITNFGNNPNGVIAQLQKDDKVKYIIFNKQIWNSKDGWKPYSGENPHTEHIHVSYIDDGVKKSSTQATPTKPEAPKKRKPLTSFFK